MRGLPSPAFAAWQTPAPRNLLLPPRLVLDRNRGGAYLGRACCWLRPPVTKLPWPVLTARGQRTTGYRET